MAELRKLTKHCKFHGLEDALSDRMVCGLKEDCEHIQRRLLAELSEKLTLDNFIKIAFAMETAPKDARTAVFIALWALGRGSAPLMTTTHSE